MMPYPKPINRAMARDNAIHCIEQSHQLQQDGKIAASAIAAAQGHAWAEVANTFPEAGDGVQPAEMTSEIRMLDDQDGDTVVVESAAWNVLRALAIRFVMTLPSGGVRLMNSEVVDTDKKILRLHWLHAMDSVGVTVGDNPVIR